MNRVNGWWVLDDVDCVSGFGDSMLSVRLSVGLRGQLLGFLELRFVLEGIVFKSLKYVRGFNNGVFY